MRMTLGVVFWGGQAVFWAGTITGVILPAATRMPWVAPCCSGVAGSVIAPEGLAPSAIARPLTGRELRGKQIYIQNGCMYCHSQYARAQDMGIGAERLSQWGDYAYDRPPMLGSERTGPDLSHEGGRRSDDWHRAHFHNPRYTRPLSIMPNFSFLTEEETEALTAYMQALGGRLADERMAAMRSWGERYRKFYSQGPARNVAHLHEQIPKEWVTMPNPYPPTRDSVTRGRMVYGRWCVGCHGVMGDGRGEAKEFLNPPPFDFTVAEAAQTVTNGIIYYQVFHGIYGTAMPEFKGLLKSEEIWDVGNYVGTAFMGWKVLPAPGESPSPAPGSVRMQRPATGR